MSLTRIQAYNAIQDIRTELEEAGNTADANDSELLNLLRTIHDPGQEPAPMVEVIREVSYLDLTNVTASLAIRNIVEDLWRSR